MTKPYVTSEKKSGEIDLRDLFFSSTFDGIDAKWSITIYTLSLLAIVTEILRPYGFSFRTVLFFDEPIVLVILPVLLGFAMTNLLILPARISKNALTRIPQFILIMVSFGLIAAQVIYMQNRWFVLISAFIIYFLVGHDEDFKNPHIATNILVSGIRAVESVGCLVVSTILVIDLAK